MAKEKKVETPMQTQDQTDEQKLGYLSYRLKGYIYPLMEQDVEGNWVDVTPASATEVNSILNRVGLGFE